MSRKVRETKKNFKVFCEGDTEYNYIDEILIVDYPDFEYIACLHTPQYKGQNVAQYIVKELGYKSVEEFKADEKIYNVLNTNGNSSDLMLSLLKRENCFVVNHYSIKKNLYEIKNSTIYDWEKLGRKGSNINEFFEVINSFYT